MNRAIDIETRCLDERRSRPAGTVLVTGATGYIGGRLVPALLNAGYAVVCLVRDARKLESRTWAGNDRVRIVEGDAANEETVSEAMSGCHAAYYLIHSMEAVGASYRERDRTLARVFAIAAASAGVSRIVYLGGLGETGDRLSEHLASRREVECALRLGSVPVTVLRAAMIIGSGSASFEILRYLVERLPVMITPRWVNTQCQPIAVRNVIHYLVGCLDQPETIGRTLDIGGPDVMTYRELMQLTAKALGLRKRMILPVPVLTPRLSSLWIHLVTPLSHRIARPLAEGLRNRVVCRDDQAAKLLPQKLLGVEEAIAAALGKVRTLDVVTTWADAGPIPGDPDWAGGTVYRDLRRTTVRASCEDVFREVCCIGGSRGYYAADWLWRVRGMLDRLVGGPGLRRGRRHPERISVGDAVDFWRVSDVQVNRRVELRAEMRLPGDASLSFELAPANGGQHCELVQTARFKPRGVAGILYWFGVLPLHGIVFEGMLQGLALAVERKAGSVYRDSVDGTFCVQASTQSNPVECP